MNLFNPDGKPTPKFYTMCLHIFGMIFSGIGTALALAYGAMDSIQHSLFPTWVTYLIIFLIFACALVGGLLKNVP